MEVTQNIKQEKADYLATEQNVNFETHILDSMEIKVEPVKIELNSNVPEPNNLVQNFYLTKEAKTIGNTDKSLFTCS